MTSQVIGALLPDLACSPRRSRQLRRRPGPFTPFGECCIGCNSAYFRLGGQGVPEPVGADVADPGGLRGFGDGPVDATLADALAVLDKEPGGAQAGGPWVEPGG